MIRVFPRRTKWTPIDELAFVGDPPLFRPPEQPVMVSCAFTWDLPEARRLQRAWATYYSNVQIGGPAFGDPGGEFIPGRFLHPHVTLTSRGCVRHCQFCVVPKREGAMRELEIRPGRNIQDNNLLACSRQHVEAVFEMLRVQNRAVTFGGGLDIRLFQRWHVDLLKGIKVSEMFFACDSDRQLKRLEKVADMIDDFSQNQKRCYALVGYGPETISQAEKRLGAIYDLGFLPFAMIHADISENPFPRPDWKRAMRKWQRPAAIKAYMENR